MVQVNEHEAASKSIRLAVNYFGFPLKPSKSVFFKKSGIPPEEEDINYSIYGDEKRIK